MPEPTPASPVRVLFVCLGNICRSPMAEGIFRDLVRSSGAEKRYHIDSAGTGAWHVGEKPDPRSVEVARRNGVPLDSHARQVEATDFDDFDYVIAMDRQNLLDLREMSGEVERGARLHLLREFDPDPEDQEVPDPYYGGPTGFDHVYAMVHRSCAALLDHLEERETRGPEA